MKVGNYVYFSGLFSDPLPKKLGKIVSEKKVKGRKVWKVKFCEPIGKLLEVTATPIHFITEKDTHAVNFDLAGLAMLNEKPLSKVRAKKLKVDNFVNYHERNKWIERE